MNDQTKQAIDRMRHCLDSGYDIGSDDAETILSHITTLTQTLEACEKHHSAYDHMNACRALVKCPEDEVLFVHLEEILKDKERLDWLETSRICTGGTVWVRHKNLTGKQCPDLRAAIDAAMTTKSHNPIVDAAISRERAKSS